MNVVANFICSKIGGAGRYYKMFEATQDGLTRTAPVHSIHGSLLAVGELLRFAIKLYHIIFHCRKIIESSFCCFKLLSWLSDKLET